MSTTHIPESTTRYGKVNRAISLRSQSQRRFVLFTVHDGGFSFNVVKRSDSVDTILTAFFRARDNGHRAIVVDTTGGIDRKPFVFRSTDYGTSNGRPLFETV